MPEETQQLPSDAVAQTPEELPMRVPKEYVAEPTPHHTAIGPILAVLIIMLILIFGGLYLWGKYLVQDSLPIDDPILIPQNNEPETPRANVDQEILNTVSSSNELNAIEADLYSTQIDSLDTELQSIENELNALGVE